MAEAARASVTGRLPRANADAVLVSALVAVAVSVIDGPDRDTALGLVERALPLASTATRIEALKPIAVEVLDAAKRRQRPDGAARWARANMVLGQVLFRDAMARAFRQFEG